MQNVQDFICWALTHAEKSTIPKGAELPLPIDACCAEPWHYLFGSVRVQTTPATLARYRQAYVNRGWAGADFDAAVAGWRSTDYATDCQGLLDSYLTYVCNDKTDINADMNYRLWCNANGPIDDITRDYVIGEAVFVSNKNGKMTHVGWICGYDSDGTPLVVEARGLRYGVVVTRLDNRPWTHRGIMDKKFKYAEEIEMEKIKFEVTSPMLTAFNVEKTLTATVDLYDGYTIDIVTAAFDDSLKKYCGEIAFDGETDKLTIARITYLLMATPGIKDATDVKINGSTADLDLSSSIPAFTVALTATDKDTGSKT